MRKGPLTIAVYSPLEARTERLGVFGYFPIKNWFCRLLGASPLVLYAVWDGLFPAPALGQLLFLSFRPLLLFQQVEEFEAHRSSDGSKAHGLFVFRGIVHELAREDGNEYPGHA